MVDRFYIDARGVAHSRNPVTTTCEDYVFEERPRPAAVVSAFSKEARMAERKRKKAAKFAAEGMEELHALERAVGIMPEERGWYDDEPLWERTC
jgi:hypothetical protein